MTRAHDTLVLGKQLGCTDPYRPPTLHSRKHCLLCSRESGAGRAHLPNGSRAEARPLACCHSAVSHVTASDGGVPVGAARALAFVMMTVER